MLFHFTQSAKLFRWGWGGGGGYICASTTPDNVVLVGCVLLSCKLWQETVRMYVCVCVCARLILGRAHTRTHKNIHPFSFALLAAYAIMTHF